MEWKRERRYPRGWSSGLGEGRGYGYLEMAKGIRCQCIPDDVVERIRNWPRGALHTNTSFVGLAGHQFRRYLGEKAFSYCGEKDENLSDAQRPCAWEMMTRPSSLELITRDLNSQARLNSYRRCNFLV